MIRLLVFAIAITTAIPGCGASTKLSLLNGNDGTGKSKASDTVRTGIQTDEMLEADPYGFRVQWIAWDSHFRDTDLRIGDRIVGVNGERYRRETRENAATSAVGNHGEPQLWAKQGADDGDRVTLTVWRRGKLLDVESKLRADRFYYTDDDRRAMGPGGPDRLKNDGFRGPWAAWYERFVKDAIHVLDGGWRRGSFNNRMLLEKHRGKRERVDYAVENYPGPFSDALKSDWQRVHDALLGPQRTIEAEELEYREIGEKRAAELKKVAEKAMRAFVERHDEATIDAFPALDPVEDDLAKVAGKVVALPKLGRRDWITEAGHGYLVAGDGRRGYYFVDSRAPAFKRALDAQFRYQQLVSPKIDDTYRIVGRIRPEPTMRVVGGRAREGLSIEPLGVMVGEAMFVDVTKVDNGRSRFAGEADLNDPGDLSAPRGASPKQVMELAITAVKMGNKSAWSELFAPWYVSVYGTGRVSYTPHYYSRAPTRQWVSARRLILDEVYAVDVVDVGLVRTVLSGDEFPDAPRIEEVDVELAHYGEFPEGYRPFTNASVTRVWTLQRRDGGPWLIVTRKGL